MEDLRTLGGILGSYRRFKMELPEGFNEELTAAKVDHHAKKILKEAGVEELTESHIQEIAASLRGGRLNADDDEWLTEPRIQQITEALRAIR